MYIYIYIYMHRYTHVYPYFPPKTLLGCKKKFIHGDPFCLICNTNSEQKYIFDVYKKD